MKRTQLYLDDDIWNLLHIQARQAGTSMSELVRRAVRDRYGNSPENRQRAMQDWVGVWEGRRDIPGSETYVRRLRKGTRLRRLSS
jgi:Arc/MetJ-type ribon-helix-helix transcriptional regulator